MIIGVIPHCLNCGADISKSTFPHYCPYCLNHIRSGKGLPSGLLEQMHLQEDLEET